MASISIVKIKIRRGTDAERRQITLDNGELGYVTDIGGRRLFIGDGVRPGGYPVGTALFYNANFNSPDSYQYAQIGDIIYETTLKQLFVVTNIDTEASPFDFTFQFLGPEVDGTSIKYSNQGNLTVSLSGVGGASLPTSNPGIPGRLWNSGGFVKVS
jgi:hypothetical protein